MDEEMMVEYNDEDLIAYQVSQKLGMDEDVVRFIADDPYGVMEDDYYEEAEEALYQ